MRDWFDALESREQSFVMIGAFVVAVALLYFLIWLPLASKHRDVKADLVVWEQSLLELKPLRSRMMEGTQTSSAVVNLNLQSPIIVVDQTLRGRGLDRYRQSSQPTTSNGIRVVFENVAFDELIVWLGDLSDKHAMHVQAGSFSAGRQGTIGRINATVTLERAL